MKCGKCGAAEYCSRACQVAAWPQHKAECKRLALVGHSVTLHGLNAAEFNGQHGVIKSWDAATGRFVVELTLSGRQIKV